MYSAIHLSPMIPSFDIAETTRFFKEVFSFTAQREEENYVVLVKDGLTIHILPAGEDIGEMEFYLEVDALDLLWRSIENKLTGIRKKAPFDRPYGMREFHLDIPGTKTLLFVGQPVRN